MKVDKRAIKNLNGQFTIIMMDFKSVVGLCHTGTTVVTDTVAVHLCKRKENKNYASSERKQPKETNIQALQL